MARRPVFCPAVPRVTQAKLRAELEATGVPLPPATALEPLDCHNTADGQFVLIVLADSDLWDDRVRQVVAAHRPDQPTTRAQSRRATAKKYLETQESDLRQVADLVARKRSFQQEQQTRAAHNNLLTALAARLPALSGLLGAAVPTWTWEQELAGWRADIDAAFPEETEVKQ